MFLKNTYCRTFQLCFGIGARLLPWHKPTCITGPGSLERVPELLRQSGASRPLIVASRRQSSAEAFLNMAENLPDYRLFSDVPANPRVSTAEAIAALYRQEACDSFVAIGGGSPMDAAKAAAALLVCPNRTVEQMGGLLKVRRKIPPFVAVPTTAGTGSETTIAAVVTDDVTHHKYAVGDLCLIPRYAVLDPELTVSLPPQITAQTGMDALTHAIEAYVGRYLPTRETARLAEKAVVTIFRYLPAAVADGSDLEAREKMLMASYQAGYAFTRGSVGNVHAIAHTLGGLYDVPHGLANAVLLPVVLADYGETIYPQMARLAELTGVCTRGTQQEKAQAFVQAIFQMNRDLGIPTGFSCIRSEDIPQMILWAEAEANPTYPVPVIYDKARFARVIEQVRQ